MGLADFREVWGGAGRFEGCFLELQSGQDSFFGLCQQPLTCSIPPADPSFWELLVPRISGQDPLVLMNAQVPFPSLAAPLAP